MTTIGLIALRGQMQINKQIFYSPEVFPAIREEIYKDCLFSESLGKHVKVEELDFEDSSHEDHRRAFWGFVLKKDKKNFLLSDKTDTADLFPFRINEDTLQKVAFKGEVYWLITDFRKVKLLPDKVITFREMFDAMSSFEHQCPDHYKLLWFQEFTQLLMSANYRNATPPGFGKDNVADTAGVLHGNVSILDDEPTKAKLEERTAVCKHLVISEVMDLPAPVWKQLEQYLLKAGAKKAQITKRTRAYGGVKEDINSSKLSVSMIYNDINNYPDMTKYVDFISKEAVLDRFVPFRLAGRLIEPFSKLHTEDIPNLIQGGIPVYKALIKSLLYYKLNYHKYLKKYKRDKLMAFEQRWVGNVHQLLDVISIYCESQEEFDKWVELINFCHQDYKRMLTFPAYYEKFKRKVPPKELEEERNKLFAQLTFEDRIKYIENYLSGDKPVSEAEWSL